MEVIKIITDEQYEELAIKYPSLFEKAQAECFHVGQGWLNIIDTLCDMITSELENMKSHLRYLKELNNLPNTKNQYSDQISILEESIIVAKKDIPNITFVKEKFGCLRFQTLGGNEETYNYIRFAEKLSMRTCESCGSPGEPRNDGWTKVLCEKHHRERNSDEE